MARAARIALWLVMGLWALFGLTWGVLHAWIVPRIGEYRPQIETMTSRALGVPVWLGDIVATSSGLVPGFELRDVRLIDPEGRVALHLPRVLASLSAASLWRLGFEQLVIDGPTLDVRRDPEGRIWVAGLEVHTDRGDDNTALRDWFFDQAEFVIRQGTLRWHDETRSAGPIALRQVDLVVRNPGRRHLLRLDATPPDEWGTRFSLMADLREPLLSLGASQPRQWAGTAYARFDRMDLSRLRTYVDLPALLGVDLAVDEGRGAMRAWADVEAGAVQGLTLDLALDRLRLHMGADRPPLDASAVGGRLQASWNPRRWELRGEQLQLHLADGQRWESGSLQVAHEAATRSSAPAWSAKADLLDLAMLQKLAPHLPLPAQALQTLDDLAPRGRVRDLQLRAELPPDGGAPQRWQARGRAEQLHLSAGRKEVPDDGHSHPGRPGVADAQLDFDASEAGGKVKLRLSPGTLTLPGVFEDAELGFQQLDGEIHWRGSGERLEIDIPQMRFANADAAGEVRARWHPAKGERPRPGVLDLTATLTRANGARVHRYLPLDVAKDARHYVRDAVRRGSASEVRFRVRGDLHDWPFRQPGQGEFRISARLADVDYDYAPTRLLPAGSAPWPGLRGLAGRFLIDGDTLSVTEANARVDGGNSLRATQINARLEQLANRQARVIARTRIGGGLGDMLGFVNRSPVGDLTGKALAQARASGNAELQLELGLPLFTLADSQVAGRMNLSGIDLRLRPDVPALTRAGGLLNFSEQGFTLAQGQARALGGELRFDGGMKRLADGRSRVEFQGQGQIGAEGLRQATELGALARLGRLAQGSTGYRLQLGFENGTTDIAFHSDLQGLALNLPAPLGKTAETSLPVRLDSSGRRLSLDVGAAEGGTPLLAARYDLDANDRVLRGGIGVGAPVPTPAQGVGLHLRQPVLDADAWNAASDGLSELAGGLDAGFAPTQATVQVDRLRLAGRDFQRLQASATREGGAWRARVQADEVEGQIEYRGAGPDGLGRVFARLERLTLGASNEDEIERLFGRTQPSSVPALDVVVERFTLGQRPLGRLEIVAVNRGGPGEVREWRLSQFSLTVPEARLAGSGNWATLAGQPGGDATARRRTALNFKLDIQDSGALLQRFGMPGTLRGGKGELSGTVGWLGSPLALDTASLTGQLRLDLERGQFLKAEPGLAKLLGVLSLQSLPRRLALDFRDVFSEGFAFDFVRGDARIERGVAHTNNLQMKGVNAAVLMEGQADIGRETQDLSVVVVPEINAGTASLIATAINPAIGLGSFLAQFLLRQPLQSAATQQFRITGPWADPQVAKVERRPAQ